MARQMDFTTEPSDCCEIGDILEVSEQKLPTSYWYLWSIHMGQAQTLKIVSAYKQLMVKQKVKLLINGKMNALSTLLSNLISRRGDV